MLIEFTVENYCSIKEPVTLSTVATGGKRSSAKPPNRRNVIPDHEIASPFRDEGRNLELLPVIGIFGANASGKSNVIEALDTFLNFVWVGVKLDSSLKAFTPFGLVSSTKEAPTCFKVQALRENTVFTYTLALNRTRILHEKLEHIPPSSRRMQNRLLYDRVWHEGRNTYVITNGKDFGNAYREIQESLREHAPFMSLLATSLTSEVAKPFTSWLGSRWGGTILGREQEEYELASQQLADPEREKLDLVTQIIRRFDTGIVGIDIEKVGNAGDEHSDQFKVWVLHEADGKRVRWRMENESTGTQRLFSLTYRMLDAFEEGGLLLIDELGSNIHPNITRAIVRMFQSEKLNPNRAQLIFTSHDNTLQRGNLLRRDQIWFTQKRADGSTELYSLSDFRPRNDLAIDKAYLDGRFGAVPILPDEEELLELTESIK